MRRKPGPAPAGYTWDGERGWVDADNKVRPVATRNERRVQQRNTSAEQARRHKEKHWLYNSGGRLHLRRLERQDPDEAERRAARHAREDERERRTTEHYLRMTEPARKRRHAWLAKVRDPDTPFFPQACRAH